jgi:Spy/CpxP family protein refolding chaperone
MKKVQTALGILLLVAGASTVAMAVTTATPEIPAGSAGSAIALVSGMLLMFRGRRK